MTRYTTRDETATIPRTVTIDGQRIQIHRIITATEKYRDDPESGWAGWVDPDDDDPPIDGSDVWHYYITLLARREWGPLGYATSRTDTWTRDGSHSHVELTLHGPTRRGNNFHPIRNRWAVWDRDELAAAAAACNAYIDAHAR